MIAAKNYRSDYKPTLNLAVDMVGMALTHCRKFKKTPERIRLAPPYWALFCDYVKENQPDCFDPYGIEWESVVIVKGTIWQKEALMMDFPQPKPAEA